MSLYELPPDEVRPGEIVGLADGVPLYAILDVEQYADGGVFALVMVDDFTRQHRYWAPRGYWPTLAITAVIPGSPAAEAAAAPHEERDLWALGPDGVKIALMEAGA